MLVSVCFVNQTSPTHTPPTLPPLYPHHFRFEECVVLLPPWSAVATLLTEQKRRKRERERGREREREERGRKQKRRTEGAGDGD